MDVTTPTFEREGREARKQVLNLFNLAGEPELVRFVAYWRSHDPQ